PPPRAVAASWRGARAAITQRVTLGVGCMASFPIRDPLVLAYQWASLDTLSEGRMLLAVCTGLVYGRSDDEGRPWRIPDKQRASRMAENIDVLRAVWTGKTVSFDGRFTKFMDYEIRQRPVQDPCPIWIAANPGTEERARGAMKRVALKADGLMSTQSSLRRFRGMLDEELGAAGRDVGTFPVIAYHNINVNDDAAKAHDESKRVLDAHD